MQAEAARPVPAAVEQLGELPPRGQPCVLTLKRKSDDARIEERRPLLLGGARGGGVRRDERACARQPGALRAPPRAKTAAPMGSTSPRVAVRFKGGRWEGSSQTSSRAELARTRAASVRASATMVAVVGKSECWSKEEDGSQVGFEEGNCAIESRSSAARAAASRRLDVRAVEADVAGVEKARRCLIVWRRGGRRRRASALEGSRFFRASTWRSSRRSEYFTNAPAHPPATTSFLRRLNSAPRARAAIVLCDEHPPSAPSAVAMRAIVLTSLLLATASGLQLTTSNRPSSAIISSPRRAAVTVMQADAPVPNPEPRRGTFPWAPDREPPACC